VLHMSTGGTSITFVARARATQFEINAMPDHKNRAWLASIRRL
jgi:hypothetical protein